MQHEKHMNTGNCIKIKNRFNYSQHLKFTLLRFNGYIIISQCNIITATNRTLEVNIKCKHLKKKFDKYYLV